jgi:excisionase family DNA binding protein
VKRTQLTLSHLQTVSSRRYVVVCRPLADLKGVIVESESRDYQMVMDNALQLVYSHYHRLVTQLAPETFQSLSLDQLRGGPLGQDLLRLARLARGQVREPQELVLEAIDSVLQLLFWPVAADDYTVPRSFWDTDLGRMLALAKYRAYDQSELVSIGNAAQQLEVTRPTIYRWMDEKRLNYVRDDMSGRTFVVRRDIDHMKTVELEYEAGV